MRAKFHKQGMIQQLFVKGRQVRGPVLRLAAPSPKEKGHYVSVLQVEGISFALKSPEEQRVLNEQFQSLLAGLSQHFTIFWRVMPLQLDQYRAQFQAPTAEDEDEKDLFPLLQHSNQQFLEHLRSQRALFERQVYLFLHLPAPSSDTLMSPWQRLRSWFLRVSPTERRLALDQEWQQAGQELDQQVEEVLRALHSMHLSARRLAGRELIRFYHSCLHFFHALEHALPDELIDGLERPVQRGWLPSKPPLHRSLSPSLPSGDDREAAVKEEAVVSEAAEQQEDFAQLADLVAPSSITLAPDHLCIDEGEYVRVIRVLQLPRVVSPNWLDPLFKLEEPIEVSFLFQPRNSASMLSVLRRRDLEYRASQLAASKRGGMLDPSLTVAQDDIGEIMMRLASGEERLLSLNMLVVVHADDREALEQRTTRIFSVLRMMLLSARIAYFEQDRAWRSCLPHGANELVGGMLLDSRSASTLFPFVANSLFHPNGTLEGVTNQGDLVVLDPWDDEMANANRIILGAPGWGKSHTIKASLIRDLIRTRCQTRQSQWIIIDPEREFVKSTLVFSGQSIRLAPGSGHCLNPFDLPKEHEEDEEGQGNRLFNHIQRVQALLEVMLADRLLGSEATYSFTPDQKALLDDALIETYRRVGITDEQRTHDRPAPLMRDLYEVLASGICGTDEWNMTKRLRRFVFGSLSGLFAGPTNVALDGGLITFDLRDLGPQLRPAGLVLVSNFVWTTSTHSTIPRHLVIDEAGTLKEYERGTLFLEDLVRRARKYYLGVTLISQTPEIFERICSYCETHMIFHQEAGADTHVERIFHLSPREAQLVRRLGIGEALLLTSTKRLQIHCQTSVLEHLIANTKKKEELETSATLLKRALQRLLALGREGEEEQRRYQNILTHLSLPASVEGTVLVLRQILSLLGEEERGKAAILLGENSVAFPREDGEAATDEAVATIQKKEEPSL